MIGSLGLLSVRVNWQRYRLRTRKGAGPSNNTKLYGHKPPGVDAFLHMCASTSDSSAGQRYSTAVTIPGTPDADGGRALWPDRRRPCGGRRGPPARPCL